MNQLPVVKLQEIAKELADSGQRVKVLWQEPGSLAFVARGREYRSEFHINGSDEVTYMIKGTMNLHYRTPEGKEEIAVIPEGSTNYAAWRAAFAAFSARRLRAHRRAAASRRRDRQVTLVLPELRQFPA